MSRGYKPDTYEVTLSSNGQGDPVLKVAKSTASYTKESDTLFTLDIEDVDRFVQQLQNGKRSLITAFEDRITALKRKIGKDEATT